jgi:hypothetical protein
MPTTIKKHLENLDISDDSLKKVEEILSNAEFLVNGTDRFIEDNQEVCLTFFIVSKDHPVTIFMPHMSIVDSSEMTDVEYKDRIELAIRSIATKMQTQAIICVTESWVVDKKMNEAEIEFCNDHGVCEHPEAFEAVVCSVSFNIRGQSRTFSCIKKIFGKQGEPRTLQSGANWDMMPSEGRLCVEAMYLEMFS